LSTWKGGEKSSDHVIDLVRGAWFVFAVGAPSSGPAGMLCSKAKSQGVYVVIEPRYKMKCCLRPFSLHSIQGTVIELCAEQWSVQMIFGFAKSRDLCHHCASVQLRSNEANGSGLDSW
jgi:hypothetical protein